MAVLRVTFTLNLTTGIPEDRPVNVWHVRTDTDPFDVNDLVEPFQAIYDTVRPWLSGQVSEFAHIMKVYDLADPEPRAPVLDTLVDLHDAPSGDPLPTEVALCLSFQGERISGESQKRRRGRVYFGPLGVQALGSDGRPDPDLVADVVDAGANLTIAGDGSGGWVSGIYSRSDDLFVRTHDGWVDNAFDIQRRRGISPTSRATYTAL